MKILSLIQGLGVFGLVVPAVPVRALPEYPVNNDPAYHEYEAPAGQAPAYGAAYHGDPSINSRRTEHFIFRWGPEPKDGMITEQVAQGHLQMLEHYYDTIRRLGLRGVGGNDPRKPYKAVVMPGNTWKWDGPTGAVGFGEGPGVTGLHVPANTLAWQRGNGCTPHEVGHGWQNQAGLPACQPPGYTESLANWIMSLHLGSYPSQWPAVGITANHACQCYNHYAVFNHFLDRPGFGTPFINRLVFDPNLNTREEGRRLADDLYRKAIRVDTSGAKDPAGTVRDELGLMNARILDLDFWNRAADRQYAREKDVGQEFFFFNRIKMVRQPGETDAWYRPELTCTPQVGGNSYIPLTVTATGPRRTIACLFRPGSDALRASWFRVGFVAFNRNGEARYGRLWNAGANTFTLADDEDAVYLAVYANPREHNWAYLHNDYTGDRVAMMPYRLRLLGAEPREFAHPAPTTGFKRHANGGGIVADTAAVDASAWVGTNAMVLGAAKVHGRARIEDFAVVTGKSEIGRPGTADDPVVSGHAYVTDDARVHGHGKVRDHAWVWGKSEVFENGVVMAHTMLNGGKVHGHAVLVQAPLRDKGLSFSGDYGGWAIRGGDQSGGGTYTNKVWIEFYEEENGALREKKVDHAGQFLGYSFEKQSGAYAMDQLGLFHGHLMNEPRVVADSMGGTHTHVLALDGRNQYVELPAAALDRPEATLAAWVKWSGGAADQCLFSFGDGAKKAMWLTPQSRATGRLRFVITDGVQAQALDGAAPLQPETWTHVAVTLSKAGGALYVNGAKVAQQPAMNLQPDQLHAPCMANANYLGRGNAGNHFAGRVDEFRIFMWALNDAGVAAARTRVPAGRPAASDTEPPSPAPAWLVAPGIAPKALTGAAVTMTAMEAQDPGGVLYYFNCKEDPRRDSGWISEPKFTDCLAPAGMKSTYTVRMKDLAGNATAESAPASVTPPPPDRDAPVAATAGFEKPPRGRSDTSIIMTAARAPDADELVMYRFSRVGAEVNSGWTSSRTWTDTGLLAGQSYRYIVQTQDGRGNVGKASAPSAGAVARDDTPPPLSPIRRLQWDGEPIALLDARVHMCIPRPADPDDGIKASERKAKNGPEVWFECVEKPEVNSGWMAADTWISQALPDGTWTFRFKLRDRSPQKNETEWSATSQARILPTNSYHDYPLAKLAGLPDSTLARFAGTVTEVKGDHYIVSDGGAGIQVTPRSFGHRTEPSFRGQKVTVSGHLWTFTGTPKRVTYAWVVPQRLTGRIECEGGRLISNAFPAYHPSASYLEAVSFWNSPEGFPNGVEFGNLAATKQVTVVASVGGEWTLVNCYVNGEKRPDLKLNGDRSMDRYVATRVELDIPEGGTLRLESKEGHASPNLDYLVLGATHGVEGAVSGFTRPTAKAPVRVYFSSAADPFALPEYIAATDGKGGFRTRLTAGKWNAVAATLDEVGTVCQLSPRLEVTIGADRPGLAFSVAWVPGRRGRIEAETGRPLGRGGIQPAKGASGDMLVAYIDGTGDGVEFTNVGAGKRLRIGYATPGRGPYGLYVNDRRVMGVPFEGSGGWDKVKEVVVDVDIPEHATLKFQRDEGDGAWNVDFIEIE